MLNIQHILKIVWKNEFFKALIKTKFNYLENVVFRMT